MGNDQVTLPAGSGNSTGWFGNITNNLANLVGVATPVVTALTTKGTKAGSANASPAQTANPVGGMSMKTILLIVGGLVVLGAGAFLLFRKGGR